MMNRVFFIFLITFHFNITLKACIILVMSRVKHTGDFESLEVTDGKVKIHQRDTIKPRENFYIEELPWTEKQKRFIEISRHLQGHYQSAYLLCR